MVEIISEVGSDLANSYVTLAEADAYFEMMGYTAWSEMATELRISLVIRATQYLDSYFRWYGVKTSPDQSLEWPRIGVEDGQYLYSSDVIPKALKKATFELASYISQGGNVFNESTAIDKLRVSSIAIEFSDTKSVEGIPNYIRMLVNNLGYCLIGTTRNIKPVEIIR